jgi:short-subunit dehydrogenase
MRSVVISGASRGLGAALAEALAAPGVALHLLGRDAAALEAVAGRCRALGAEVWLAALDVTDAGAMATQLRDWDAARPVGLAVANAGTSAGTGLDGVPEGHAAALRQVRVNLEGAMNLVEPLLPGMLARGAGQVLLVGSVMGFFGAPDVPGYAASKAGLWAYGEALRAAHGSAGVRVTVAAPGFFESAMSARVQGPRTGGQVSAAAMAARLLEAVARGRGRVVSPWWLGAALRALALLPPGLGDRLARLVRFRVAPGG